MSLFGRRSKTSIGLYGKHPAAADFVNVEASSEALRSFDQWLSNALIRAERLADDWSTLYDRASPVRFLFDRNHSGKSARALIGCMIPSRDASGRRFPLLVFADLDRAPVVSDYPSLPHHRFLDDAAALLARAASWSKDEIVEATQRLRPPDERDWEQARRSHGAYLDHTDSADAFSAVFAGDGAQAPGALRTLEDVGHSLRDPNATPRYGVRCPLGQPGGQHAALWLALLQQASATPITPCALWSDSAMLLYFNKLSSKALTALWRPNWSDDTVCDLAANRSTREGRDEPVSLPHGSLRRLLR